MFGLSLLRPSLARLHIRLLVLILVSALPAFAIIAYSSAEQHTKAVQDAHGRALAAARIDAGHHRGLIVHSHQLLASLARLPEVRGRTSDAACNELLAGLLKLHRQYDGLIVARRDGQVRCSGVPLSGPLNVADRAYFRRVFESMAFATGDYQTSRITGRSIFVLAHPVVDDEGTVQAVVAVTLDLNAFGGPLAELALPRDAVVSLVDSRGITLARQPPGKDGIGKPLPDLEGFRLLAAQGGDGTLSSRGPDGAPSIVGFAPVDGHGEGGVYAYVHVGIPAQAALAEAQRISVRNLVLLGLATALMLLLGWWASRRLILRPVERLSEIARRLGGGDLGARTGLRAAGELGQLGRAFDAMADELQRRELLLLHAKAELRRSNRALRLLNRVNGIVNQTQEMPSLLQNICQAVIETGGYFQVRVGQALHDEARTVRLVAQAGAYPLDAGELRVRWDESERGRGPSGSAIRTGQTALLRDVATDPDFEPWREEALERGDRSVLALPLRVQDGVWGALSIVAAEPDAFDAKEVVLLEEAATHLAFGIEALRTRAARARAEQAQVDGEARIEYLATRDALTGLPNRRLLIDRIEQALAHAGRTQRTLALAVLNLDRLKLINDSLGHAMGDRLLVAVGQRLQEAVRGGDTVARLGGDELAILFTDLKRPDGALTATVKAHDAFVQPFSVGGHELRITASLGTAVYPSDGDGAEPLLQHAHAAMHRAKAEGGNGFQLYALQMSAEAHEKVRLEQALRAALSTEEELELHYQPQVELASGRVCGVEALARWRHPELGMVSPARFIPLAEETGLIAPMTEWILRTACTQMLAWQRAGVAVPRVAVNLSARHFWQGDVVELVSRVLAETGLPPQRLELEITESMVMRRIEDTVDALQELRTLGVTVSLDDFGTGYSSLSYLRRLPIDKIKIDQSFVRDVRSHADATLLVKEIIHIAHAMQRMVVAEGVETQEIADFLLEHGCDGAQGYHFSKPLPAQALADWFARTASPATPSSA